MRTEDKWGDSRGQRPNREAMRTFLATLVRRSTLLCIENLILPIRSRLQRYPDPNTLREHMVVI